MLGTVFHQPDGLQTLTRCSRLLALPAFAIVLFRFDLALLHQWRRNGTYRFAVDPETRTRMTGYFGPEKTRSDFRRKQAPPSKRMTEDILQALRTQGGV
jgi:hypothetical protein